MNALFSRIAPGVADAIRSDHTKVLALFHRYDADAAPHVKQALVEQVCTLLEIHARAEEEVFYAAVRAHDPALVEKSIPEHDEMRRRIAMLKTMDPASEQYDQTFMELMRNVIHHVADEETALLPAAERSLGAERLARLGGEFTARRIQLGAPRAGEIATNALRGVQPATVAMAAGALLAGFAVARGLRRR